MTAGKKQPESLWTNRRATALGNRVGLKPMEFVVATVMEFVVATVSLFALIFLVLFLQLTSSPLVVFMAWAAGSAISNNSR
jgi:hypothetical protein